MRSLVIEIFKTLQTKYSPQGTVIKTLWLNLKASASLDQYSIDTLYHSLRIYSIELYPVICEPLNIKKHRMLTI